MATGTIKKIPLNIDSFVYWYSSGTYTLKTNHTYLVVGGNNAGYCNAVIVYDGAWKIYGVNNVGLSISGNTLTIPIYVRVMILSARQESMN